MSVTGKSQNLFEGEGRAYGDIRACETFPHKDELLAAKR